MGTFEQKERFFAPFRQRERPVWAAFAMTEPDAGSDVARIKTRAIKTKGLYPKRAENVFVKFPKGRVDSCICNH